MTNKKCTSCQEEKCLSLFSTNGKSRQGTRVYQSMCKACRSAQGVKKRDKKLTKVCDCCGTEWRMGVGEVNKDKMLCPTCYPLYRAAFNLDANAKHRATKQGLDYDLDIEFVYSRIKQGRCERTGIEFSLDYNGRSFKDRSPYTPSVDKIDPTKGYTKDNVQFVCWWYNLAKSTFSDKEVLELCKKLVNHASSNT